MGDFSDGKKILNDRYKIKEKIGEGSYGSVYKAIDIKNNDRLVAIKQVSKERINDSDYLYNALQKELKIMRLCKSENSVELYEDFETEDNYNLVMELCDSDLDKVLKKRVKTKKIPFLENEVRIILLQFNNILRTMFDKSVIHRDLKLKNIMVKNDDNVPVIKFIIKLSDFGFSKIMGEDLTSTNLGSPVTKAPEVMKGEDYNSKADLWSIGVMTFQLLFDCLPFPARNERELRMAIDKSKEVTIPFKKNGEPINKISDTCFDLIKRLLKKDPSDRISFEDYFNHDFFKEKICEEINVDTKTPNKENKIEEEDAIKNIKEDDFNKKFIELRKISDDLQPLILYKAKNKDNDKIVFIKQIIKSYIDNNKLYKKIFDKEINLLETLKGNNFPEFYGLYITEKYYNIVLESFSGNILDDYIEEHKSLNESFFSNILSSLKDSLIYLSRHNIVLEYISPKSFAFSKFESETKFNIKFFDYGLHSIFLQEHIAKSYLLTESDVGDVKDQKTNVLGFGLTMYKVLFGEDAYQFQKGDNIKECFSTKKHVNKSTSDNYKNFIENICNIQKENRYSWREVLEDKLFKNLKEKSDEITENKTRKINDSILEIIIENLIKKFKYIENYFTNIEKKRQGDFDDLLKVKNDLLLFLLFNILEIKTIIKFLEAKKEDKDKIDLSDQEIYLVNIKDEKFTYDYINFYKNTYEKNKCIESNLKKSNSNTNKKDDIGNYFEYNRENPIFGLYKKDLYELKEKFNILYKSIKESKIDFSCITNSNSNSSDSNDGDSNQNDIKGKNVLIFEKKANEEENLDLPEPNNSEQGQEGNIENLFIVFFESTIKYFSNKEYETSAEELTMAQYISEYSIFLRLVLSDYQVQREFEKFTHYFSDEETVKLNYKSKNVMLVSFIGGKYKKFYSKGILNEKHYSNKNVNKDLHAFKEDNIKMYYAMIFFYLKQLDFMNEIEKKLK